MARKGSGARSAGVRSLERGLALLVAMNRRKLPSVVELARETRLPRPTVYRLLETLHRAGFVMRSRPVDRSASPPKFAASAMAFSKTIGLRKSQRHWLQDAVHARSGVARGADDVRTRPHAGARDHARSQRALIDHGMVGRSLPMLRTAAGRCYLACCSANERRAILKMLRTPRV